MKHNPSLKAHFMSSSSVRRVIMSAPLSGNVRSMLVRKKEDEVQVVRAQPQSSMAALFFLGCCFSLFFSNDLQGLQCAPLSFCPHKCRKDVVDLPLSKSALSHVSFTIALRIAPLVTSWSPVSTTINFHIFFLKLKSTILLIVLNKVLLVGTKSSTCIGMPIVTNASVNAVVEQLLDDKAIVFKYKNYRRNIGHRQPITPIKITGITVMKITQLLHLYHICPVVIVYLYESLGQDVLSELDKTENLCDSNILDTHQLLFW
uniref:Uncharacterized protein n=1 Tax=Chenopodium quinoa TaxID=63459 RepID=A0A803N4N4_CHEQI